MIDTAKAKLRDLAEARLSLYVREMGQEFYDKLVANKANWRAGYVPAHDCYWCTPQTADGRIIVGPFTVVKWTWHELRERGVPCDALDVLVQGARDTGFEQWEGPNLPFNADWSCDFCGRAGAHDHGGDYVCGECAKERLLPDGSLICGGDIAKVRAYWESQQ